MTYVVAIDAGTTGVRSRAVFADGRETISSYLEFTQYFPAPGLVEHDADEIWRVTHGTLVEVIERIGSLPAAIGITNQRETVVAWDRTTGDAFGRAIVWQDRRTSQRCVDLAPHLDLIRGVTGLVLDPYFSGTKIEWLLANGVPRTPSVAFGTVDSWLLWKLTGGAVFATDESNASRTLLWDIRRHEWSAEICDLLGVPIDSLPTVHDSSGRFGTTSAEGLPTGIPISGIAGDQQAALFGQACFTEGDTKNTYGTGSFILMNAGTTFPVPAEGMLTTVAWRLGGVTTYAVEGSIFVTGAAVQWLRDGLGIISESREIETLAGRVTDSGGVVFVPALTGLGSPWWDPDARGAVFGITRGTTAAHLALATLEATAFQTRDVVDAMVAATGIPIRSLRVDGGAAGNDRLMQIQADQLGIDVERPVDRETTAAGAALLAGLAEGVWSSLDAVAATRAIDRRFIPNTELKVFADIAHAQWRAGVARVTEKLSPPHQ
ncbi:MAG: glycerol kinase [Actinobacteria bacterium]|nr:glycerol kinase [Actinomycetota bacterium]